MSRGLPRPPTAVLWTVFGLVAAAYLVMVGWVLSGPYLPGYSDEFAYFQDARSFALNHSLGAVYLADGHTAPIGDLGPHGPAFALLHGMIAAAFGEPDAAIPLTNGLLVALGIAALWIGDLRGRERVVAAIAILAFPLVPVVFAGYVQEAVQICLAAAGATALVTAYRIRSRGDPARRAIIAFVVLIGIATLLRPSAVILGVALLPLARGRRQLAIAGAAWAAACLAAAVYLQLFFASGAEGISSRSQRAIDEGGIHALLSSIGANARTNISGLLEVSPPTEAYFWLRPVAVGLVAVLLGSGAIRRDRLALGAGLAGGVTIVALLLLYDLGEWTGLRMLGPLFVLAAVVMAARGPRIALACAIVVSTVAIVPAVQFLTATTLPGRRAVGVRALDDRGLSESVATLRWAITCRDGLATVLASPAILTDEDPRAATLPVRSRDGCRVRYVFNVSRAEFDTRLPLRIDYLLAPAGAGPPRGRRLVVHTQAYDLYSR